MPKGVIELGFYLSYMIRGLSSTPISETGKQQDEKKKKKNNITKCSEPCSDCFEVDPPKR